MKFLIVNFNNGLGNTILSNSSFKLIKENIKDSTISIVSNNRDGDLDISDINPAVSLTINFRKISLFKKINFLFKVILGHYDYIVFTPFSSPNLFSFSLFFIFGRATLLLPIYYKELNSPRRYFFLKLLKFFRRVSFSGKELFGDMIDKNFHEIDANLNLVSKLFPKNYTIDKKYNSNSLDINFSENILKKYSLKKNDYICVQYGASHGNLTPKIWDEEKTIHLVNSISNFSKVIILGNSKDRKLDNTKLNNLNILDLMGKTSLSDLANLLKFSQKNICFDSGTMHLADAIQSNLLAIFGPTNIKKNKPKNSTSQYIYKEVSCSPCILGWNFVENYISEKEAYNDCKSNFKCMENISVEDVLRLI
ncbi:glycosyltransferase family 9 protein [Candidatus Pelagibacter sp. Uisw_094]|uniref:glycosyltransferase family 9 protein n=1 Tax=Candidatus Pelagibacter sp. Uisw_094 TaxID=3230980 RepID=UPI0039ECB98E|tara:strand:- start:162 stop:1256 length:1095 start_codon:yes stop_codon:yes gene_type:complete